MQTQTATSPTPNKGKGKGNKPATPATPATVTGPVITVTPAGNAANLKGARGAWLNAVKAFNGQTVAAFTASVTANPPSTPAKGKLAGKLEPVGGWLGWLKRNGYITIA